MEIEIVSNDSSSSHLVLNVLNDHHNDDTSTSIDNVICNKPDSKNTSKSISIRNAHTHLFRIFSCYLFSDLIIMSDINHESQNRDKIFVYVPRDGALGGVIIKKYVKQNIATLDQALSKERLTKAIEYVSIIWRIIKKMNFL
jgi:hypothetical protein